MSIKPFAILALTNLTFDMNQMIMKMEDFDLIKSFDEIKGPDIFTLEFDSFSYFGFIDQSPIEPRLIENFDYQAVYTNYTKPFRAHWMLSDAKLQLMYCNCIINRKRLYTTDIFPEFAGNDILHFFYFFTGDLVFYPLTFKTTNEKKFKYKGQNMMLQIKSGILTKVEYSLGRPD